MKKLIVLIVVLVAMFGLAGCYDNASTPTPSAIQNVPNGENSTTTKIVLDASNVTTVGNNSWIAINVDGRPHQYKDDILEILRTFEEMHPELVVLDWKIDNEYPFYVYGIWVHHRPKTAAELEAPPQ